MRIGIFGNDYQSDKLDCIKRVFDYLLTSGAEVYAENSFYDHLSEHFGYKPVVSGLIHRNFQLDIALSIGGDGTFLRTAGLIGNKNIPIMGINTGRLGFLADINANDIEVALGEILKNYYRIEERSLLHLEVEGENSAIYRFALNEIAVLKRDTSSMINIHTYINNEYLASYSADGLVIATPTGSTAYSLSVNGPILIPQAKNIILSPVAPHSLNVRPLVIPDDSILKLNVETRSSNFLIAVDGGSEVFASGTKFTVKKAGFTIKVIKRHDHTFYQTLREKLMWGKDSRELSNSIN